jgi:hypothetical protein
MSGTPDHDRASIRPFLIERDKDEGYRLVIRETRYNSQNYPIVTATPVGGTFSSPSAARAFAKENLGARTGEFATK